MVVPTAVTVEVRPKNKKNINYINRLNSYGGRILILFTLVIVGLIADRVGVPYAKEIVLTTLATLLAALAGQRHA